MKNKGIRSVLAAALALSLTLSTAIIAGATGAEPAGKVDLDSAMSVTAVASGSVNEENTPAYWLSKLNEADGTLVYDLYKVADINTKGNAYEFVAVDEFAGYQDSLDAVSKPSRAGEDGAPTWTSLASTLLGDLFGTEDGDAVNGDRATFKGCALGTKTDLNSEEGVYLLVARGSLENTTVIKNCVQADGGTALETSLATYTLLGANTFTVSPQLIVVPTKVDENGVVVANTADPGTWLYDLNLVLKMEADPAFGSIEIDKTLVGYYGGAENATFVFQVDAYYPTEDKLYSSEVYTLQFTAAGNKHLRVDGLPLGATVKVSEIYSGINYDADIKYPDAVNIVVTKDDVKRASFTNTYNKRRGGGGGVTNHFEYNIADGAGSWSWSQLDDNAMSYNGLSMKMLQKVVSLTGNQ